MRTRTDTIVFRLGFTLAVLVLGAFLALIGAIVLAGGMIVGGPAGWAAGVVLAIVVAQATRRPCGALIGRLVASV
jgi:tetrahydromethanopterin S-methyltransferase subunit F